MIKIHVHGGRFYLAGWVARRYPHGKPVHLPRYRVAELECGHGPLATTAVTATEI